MEPGRSTDIQFPSLVLSTILDHVDSKKDLLSWRLVTPELKAKATKLLNKRVHSEFVQWNRCHFPERRAASPIPPEVRLLPANVGQLVVGELLPNVNPLFTSSLRLVDWGTDVVEEAEMNVVFLYRLLSTHGSLLTSLSINKSSPNSVLMSLKELSKLLSYCPNLEAIRIRGGHKVGGGDRIIGDVPQVPFPHLPKLTYFDCDDAYDMFRWLTSNLSHQLTHLDSTNPVIPAFTMENYPQKEGVVGTPFHKLQTLKVFLATNSFLSNDGTPIPMHLEKLSILNPIVPVTEQVVCNFVAQFRDSLIELTLEDIDLFPKEEVVEVWGEEWDEIHEHCNFPNLVKFALSYEFSTRFECPQVQIAKQHFLPFFPKLEELDVICRTSQEVSFTVKDATAFVERNQLWSFCPTLKSIRFLEYSRIRPNEELVANVMHMFTKKE